MKKVYTAIALFVLIILVGFAEYHAVNRSADDILALVDRAQSEDNVEELAHEIRSSWEQRKPTLMLFLPHSELDAADAAAEKLIVCAELSDELETKAALSDLYSHMTALKESERISIYNLF